MSPGGARPETCPACRRFGSVPLAEVSFGPGAGHFCPACDGIWLGASVQVLALGRRLRRDRQSEAGALACPACPGEARPALHRSHVPIGARASVEVDLCTACGGVWLDRGELQAVRRARAAAVGAAARERDDGVAAAPESRSEGAAGTDVVELRCPHCGAPCAIADEDSAVTCAHCGSWLTPIRPPDYEVLWLPASVTSAEQLARIVVHARVSRLHLEAFGHLAPLPRPEDQAELERGIERERRRLVEGLQVGRRRLVYVPYWHFHGVDYLAALGRPTAGIRREARLLGRRWEHTEPGYDTGALRLSDAGVRLGIGGCRLLTREDLAGGVEAAAVVGRPAAETPEHHRPHHRLARFEDFDETSRLERGLWARTHLVFKPYWVVRFSLTSSRRSQGRVWWSLVDASRGSLAGDLDPGEEAALLRAPSVDPFGARDETRVEIVSSRCPECGVDQVPDRRAWVRVCPNCHEGLAMTPRGFARTPYSVAVSEVGEHPDGHVPFWRLRVSWDGDAGESQPAASARAGDPAARDEASAWLWIPALRLLGTKLGDDVFQRLVRWACDARLEVEERQLPITTEGRLLPASVPEAQARELVPAALCIARERRPPAEARRAVESVRLGTAPALVMVPARLRRRRWYLPGLVGGVPEVVVSGER